MGAFLGASQRGIAATLALAGSIAVSNVETAWAQAVETLPELLVTASRLGTGITGASTSVITAQEIERSPGQTLQDILAREPGVQVRSLFGMVNGARTAVDLRGFGATATANTLVLVNGRRLNDIDLAGVDFSAIPKASIERIEITRGNSGAVLYGDGAVGGVINIITKTGVDLPPSLRIQGAFGSYRYYEGNLSANGSAGGYSAAVYANGITSEGYRENNRLNQKNAVGDFRWTDGQGTSVYLNVSGDNQHLGLPGGRLVTATTSLVATDPRGAATPFDNAAQRGANVTLGVTRVLWPGTELIVDGGVRQKVQEANFFSAFGSIFDSRFDATLTTLSLTPRIASQHVLAGLPAKLLAGVDVYNGNYDSDRAVHQGDPPNHRYDLKQTTVAGYFQETVSVLSSTDVAVGARLQGNRTTARDRLDATAPGGAFLLQGLPLDQDETQWAAHFGIEHRLTGNLALFGRVARAFRLPTVDERVAMSPFGVPTSFDLKTQTSHDVEGGARVTANGFSWQTSAYLMDLTDELFFSPATFTNLNLDPTRRYGVESLASWQATDTLRLKGGVAYTRAIFREGPFEGNDVPLVSRWTASAGVSWNVYEKYVVFDAAARWFGPRRMDNDAANVQPFIPGKTLVDLRVGGEIDKFFWSFGVQNLFDVQYFEYAIASTFTLGTYNAYPLPGRTFIARAGMTF